MKYFIGISVFLIMVETSSFDNYANAQNLNPVHSIHDQQHNDDMLRFNRNLNTKIESSIENMNALPKLIPPRMQSQIWGTPGDSWRLNDHGMACLVGSFNSSNFSKTICSSSN